MRQVRRARQRLRDHPFVTEVVTTDTVPPPLGWPELKVRSVSALFAETISRIHHGRSVSFMAKYDFNDTGSSCHVHSSLWDTTGEKPLMWEADAPEHQSAAFRGWLGGQLACRIRRGGFPRCWPGR